MPKTKAVESKENEVTKKSTTKKDNNIDTETVEKEEPNKLVAKTEKKLKITAKKAKEETTSIDVADIKISARAAYAATEVSQSIIGEMILNRLMPRKPEVECLRKIKQRLELTK